MRSQRDQAGLTLIELLFAMGIMAIAATGIYQLLMVHHANYQVQESLADRLQRGRTGLSTLSREIRWTGYGLLTANALDFSTGQACHPWSSSKPYEITGQQTLRILSNLHGIQTYLTQAAFAGASELSIPHDRLIQEERLPVSRGQKFQRNDTIYIYHLDQDESLRIQHVECHRLISSGSSGRIRLAPGDSLRTPFPPGSPIHVVNELHYFFDPNRKRLMRRLDGGTDVLTEGVEDVVFVGHGDQVLIRFDLKEDRFPLMERLHVFKSSVVLRNR